MEFPPLDPVFHQPARFRIMVLLYRNRQAAAVWIMRNLKLSDGNLRSHAEKLVRAGHVEQGRVLTRDGFQVRYRITPRGDSAFRQYLQALRRTLDEAPDDAVQMIAEDAEKAGHETVHGP